MKSLRLRLQQVSLYWSRIQFDFLLRLALLTFLGVAVLYLLPLLPEATMQQVDAVTAEFLLLTLTVALFVTAALRGRDTAARYFWAFMALSFGCWFVAQISGHFLRAESPWLYNFLKDLLFLAHSCLVVVIADLRPGTLKSPIQTLRARLAATSSVLLIVGLFGYTALVPALSGIRGYESPFAVYACLDVYIAIRFLIQGALARSKNWRTVMMFIGGGFALISLADLIVVAFQANLLEYRPGQPLNLLWYLFYVPLFLASRIPVGNPHVVPPVERGDESEPINLAPILSYSIAIPLVHLGGYGLGWLDENSRAVRDLFVFAWLAVATIALCWHYLLLRSRLASAVASKASAEQEADNLQRQLRQAQRIEMAGQLSGGLAHEFGNSLFGAETLAQQIYKDATETTSVVKSEQAKSLVDALAGSRELVRKFNYLGRGEDLEAAVVNVVADVRNTIELVKPGISRSIRISFHCDSDDIGVIARKQDLQQITLNLLLNARDSVGEKGFVDVHVGQAPASLENCASCGAMIAGEHVWLRVSDSGPGVPDSLRRRIFEPLITSKPAGQGSGLGLSIVHAIVHQLRGHIVLGESRQAHCSFTIMLPAVQLNVSGSHFRANAAARHLLVVESDEVIAEYFRADSNLHDLHVNRVSSADAATVILQQPDSPPDTVIVGNMHNPMDVVAIIDAASALSDCRLVICARRGQRAILESLDGIDTFLDQPVDADIFASVILRPASG